MDPETPELVLERIIRTIRKLTSALMGTALLAGAIACSGTSAGSGSDAADAATDVDGQGLPSPKRTAGFWAPGPGFSLDEFVQAQQPQGRRGSRRQDYPPQEFQPKPYHQFYFTRAVYTGGMGRGWRTPWATDFPKADRQFLYVIGRTLELLDLYELENPVRLDDPALLDFPFLYALEVGGMTMTEAEVTGLRDYLERGGFLVIDDFWGTWEWENFESEIRRVFPARPIVELTPEHELFNVFYEINEIIQVPSVARARRGGPTWEQDGYEAHVRGIFDDNGRLMVVINWNTDLGDAWEWSENPGYPFEYSNFAHKLGVNFIIYSMTH